MTYEFVPEKQGDTAICEKCGERMDMTDLLTHLAVCQGIDVTRADEWPVESTDE